MSDDGEQLILCIAATHATCSKGTQQVRKHAAAPSSSHVLSSGNATKIGDLLLGSVLFVADGNVPDASTVQNISSTILAARLPAELQSESFAHALQQALVLSGQLAVPADIIAAALLANDTAGISQGFAMVSRFPFGLLFPCCSVYTVCHAAP